MLLECASAIHVNCLRRGVQWSITRQLSQTTSTAKRNYIHGIEIATITTGVPLSRLITLVFFVAIAVPVYFDEKPRLLTGSKTVKITYSFIQYVYIYIYIYPLKIAPWFARCYPVSNNKVLQFIAFVHSQIATEQINILIKLEACRAFQPLCIY